MLPSLEIFRTKAEQGFQIVIVGINDAGVNLASGRMVAGAVHQEGNVRFIATIVGRKVGKHADGLVVVTLRIVITADIL